MEDQVELLLANPENNITYKIIVSAEDARRAESDLEFAQILLQNAQRESISDASVGDGCEIELDEQPESEFEHNVIKWSPQNVLLLIRLVESYQSAFESGLKKNVWIKIASKMSSVSGKIFTSDQVDNKWKGLKKTYKKIKDHNNKSGNDRKKWEFFGAMDSFMAKKPEILPPAVASSSKSEVTVNIEGISDSDASASNSSPVSAIMKKRKSVENLVQKRHSEKMKKYDEFLYLFKISVEHQTGKKIEEK